MCQLGVLIICIAYLVLVQVFFVKLLTANVRTQLKNDLYRSQLASHAPIQNPPLEQCRVCSYRGLRCSVLETGRWYPCFYCSELGLSCEGKPQATFNLHDNKKAKRPSSFKSDWTDDTKGQIEKALAPMLAFQQQTKGLLNAARYGDVLLGPESRSNCNSGSHIHFRNNDEITAEIISSGTSNKAQLNEGECKWCQDGKFGLFSSAYSSQDATAHSRAVISPEFANLNMCGKGRMARLRMIRCGHHTMEAAIQSNPEPLDLNIIYMKLMCQTHRSCTSARNDLLTWCMMCPSPALYRCRAPMENGKAARLDEDPSEARGCGLHLCQTCTFDLVDNWGNDLSGMLMAALEELRAGKATDERPWGWRPDIVLLQKL